MKAGADVITPAGYAELVEDYGNGYLLVELPNRRRMQFPKEEVQEVQP
jgi:hypothetical protein